MNAKEAAGNRAAEFVEDGMIVGLGSGSTAQCAIAAIGRRVSAGLRIRTVATSVASAEQAQALGIPLFDVDEVDHVDLTIDGADEIDGDFNMIKGGGGALLREKIVASITTKEVIVADPSKVVGVLGQRFALPVEVAQFGHKTTSRRLAEVGSEPRLRLVDGTPYLTDNGNFIYDCHWPNGIVDAAGTEACLAAIPGVVENGLFVGLAHVLVVGHEAGRAEVVPRPVR